MSLNAAHTHTELLFYSLGAPNNNNAYIASLSLPQSERENNKSAREHLSSAAAAACVHL